MEDNKSASTISRGLVKKAVNHWAEKIKPGSFEWYMPTDEIIKSVIVKKFRKHANEWIWSHVTWSKKQIERTIEPCIERTLAIVDKVYTVVEYPNGRLEILDLKKKYNNWEELLVSQVYRLGTMSECIPLSIGRSGISAGKVRLTRNC